MSSTMAGYLRRIVSGNQTRFKDHDLKLELNLVYVTDQVIIMGYPASGIEGFYRNHKRDAVKFLHSRHGNNYWVFNFCPVKENSYDAEIFGGRVSRYPFPDHHPPPLAVMPLVAREIHTWLSGSPDRVAVLHCKAGKGRSGMMACAYLLSLDGLPVPPKLERNYTAKQWAKRPTEEGIETLPLDEKHPDVSSSIPSQIIAGISSYSSQLPVIQPKLSPPLETQIHTVRRSGTDVIHEGGTGFSPHASSTSPPTIVTPVSVVNPEKSFTNVLKDILDFHTARRMKAPTKFTEDKGINITQGVRIPSQRRFLYYWALLLAHEAPKHMWDPEASLLVQSISTQSQPLNHSTSTRPRVHLMQITLRMRDTLKIKTSIVKAASVITGKMSVSGEKSKNQLWASISKYDDFLIDGLEKWEVYTRDPQGNMGKKYLGPEYLLLDVRRGEDVTKVFEGDNWDKGKMLRSFAHFGVVDKEGDKVLEDNTDGKIHIYALRPQRQTSLQHKFHLEAGVWSVNKGVSLDAGREVRVKLYMGSLLMGWVCFIPTFHMTQPPSQEGRKSHLLFTRNEIDFPLGGIMDVEIEMEWDDPVLRVK